MRVFISYRRDDTGGRAGRLFDVLAARFGAHDVFHDVAGVAPGRDFIAQVDQAIDRSDVVLVVIGRNWLGTEPIGQRRIDAVDDFVHQEVQRALDSDNPVVPVLVDGAALPTPGELPRDLEKLAHRQSFTLSDDTWHQDVDALVRRLRGDDRALTGQARRRSWWPIAVVGGLLAVGIVIAVAVLRPGTDGSSDAPYPECETDGSWTGLEVVDSEPVVVQDEGDSAAIEVRGASTRTDEDDGGAVVLDVAATNVTDPSADDDGSVYISEWIIRSLLVDGISHSAISCWGPATGDPSLRSNQTVIVPVGFDTQLNPRDADIDLELADLTVIPVTSQP